MIVQDKAFENLLVKQTELSKIRQIRYEELKLQSYLTKSRIWETPTLSTNAGGRTNVNLKRFRDLFYFLFFYFFLQYVA